MDIIRKIVSLANRLPYNSVTAKVTHKVLYHMKDGPVKTRYGFFINFKKTGVHSTALRNLVISGTYEQPYFEMLNRLVNQGDYVIDVGAHEGYLSLCVSKMVGKLGKVFSIEPNPENLGFLFSNIKLNQATNIEVFEKAIGSKKSKKFFYCDTDGGAWGSLIPFSYFRKEKTLEVEMDTLDNLFRDVKKLDIVKVDTEGNELDVFLGAQQLLSCHKPHLCFEVSLTFWAYLDRSVDSLFNVLKSYGYELFVLRRGRLCEYKWLDERVMNMFAVHPSRKSDLLGKGILGS